MKNTVKNALIGIWLAAASVPGIVSAETAEAQETEPNRARYFCQSHLAPTETPYLHTSFSSDYARAYRSALQECRYYHPEVPHDCKVLCWRVR